MALFFLFLLCSVNGFTTATVARDFVSPARPLADGETLVSAGGTFALGFFSPSGSSSTPRRYVGIWFNNITEKTVVWVANRRNPANDSTGLLSVSGNGTLTVSWQNSTIVWSSSHRSSMKSPIAQLLDTGNFVVRESFSEEFAWQSFDYPTDTLLPRMKLGWNITSGLNRNLTSWSSDDDPSPGSYTLSLDLSSLPQLFLYSGVEKDWRVGPWNGLRLSGLPFMSNKITPFNFSYVDNPAKGEVYCTYTDLDAAAVLRLVLTSGGHFERKAWSGQRWTLFMSNPDKQCDQFSACGPFGTCDADEWPICRCMEGFRPRFPAAWVLSDWRGGCERETPLDCKNETDGFYVLKEAKLPETTYVTVDSSIGLEECRSRCLANCSCTGYASNDIRTGSGCIIWSKDLIDVNVYPSGGQDLYIRLAAVDLPRNKKWHQWQTIAVAFGVLGAFLLISFLSFCWWIRRRGKKRQVQAQKSSNNDFVKKLGESEDGMPDFVMFSFSYIAGATDNFSTNNKLGEGGFGPVYKGQLPYGKEVAVKRLSTRSGQGVEEFKNEILLIAKLQHRNLVRLLGCCIQREEKILVYEYMRNKSLDFYLFDPYRGRELDWRMRFCIIEGIAQGLLYLHKHSRLRIIHRDLKASNVLLDNDMNPKISDFGLARIFSSEEIKCNTNRIVGTYGYMAPEYASQGLFSIKSDVFSYGVLMLEILSGKLINGFYHQHSSSLTLQGYAWELRKEGKSLELMDASIADSCSVNEFLKCFHIALLCVQESAADRPTMSDVIDMLRGDGASLADPNRPAFFILRSADEADSISADTPQYITMNDLTVTIVDGR